MSETPPSPFTPFQLPAGSPPIVPEQPPAKPETAKQKASREKHEAKEAAQKDAAETTKTPAKPEPRQKRTTTPRKTKTAKTRAPKFDLQTILAAASSLKEADMPTFEKMIGMLQDAGKPARDRLLAALGKVFA